MENQELRMITRFQTPLVFKWTLFLDLRKQKSGIDKLMLGSLGVFYDLDCDFNPLLDTDSGYILTWKVCKSLATPVLLDPK